MQKIFLGSDHGAFQLKSKIKQYLIEQNKYEVIDLGTNSEASVDYPEYGKLVGESVIANPHSLGVVCCGSGIGISIATNKVKGIRCALCNSLELAELAKQHNGANVLAMGARTQFIDPALEILEKFLTTEIDQSERHERRRYQLNQI